MLQRHVVRGFADQNVDGRARHAQYALLVVHQIDYYGLHHSCTAGERLAGARRQKKSQIPKRAVRDQFAQRPAYDRHVAFHTFPCHGEQMLALDVIVCDA